jgi:hypothetical protein
MLVLSFFNNEYITRKPGTRCIFWYISLGDHMRFTAWKMHQNKNETFLSSPKYWEQSKRIEEVLFFLIYFHWYNSNNKILMRSVVFVYIMVTWMLVSMFRIAFDRNKIESRNFHYWKFKPLFRWIYIFPLALYVYLYGLLHKKHFSSVIQVLFYSDYSFFSCFKPLFRWIYTLLRTLYVYLYGFLHKKHFSCVIQALFYSDYQFSLYFKPLFGRIYISPLTSNMKISLLKYCSS